MITEGRWEVVGPDPKTTNPNTGQWGIEARDTAWVASDLKWDGATHIVELHNHAIDWPAPLVAIHC